MLSSSPGPSFFLVAVAFEYFSSLFSAYVSIDGIVVACAASFNIVALYIKMFNLVLVQRF